ncbi:hypothetical protein PPL_07220 [Heterostelium album PN500]|uniref:B box-type domain-containing protein n=1 Tax=Heterostelium pallidum (strain ATCC 26659 / Pp 5 / PN500) TaxID=670386 RepID=D3BEQ5_HETP5|nr:hypothetical protein PPL_07220 [Heterostelium album PN500]EFA80386.1 hypothetical protein PPL_07220 [Heterostelium album PN500]|eukprot:XP_020432506.1 hypothetical protein PPL_07220 [Heterostelium album PN500]
MDSNNSTKNFGCEDHQREFEIICYQCNKLFCSRCLVHHNNQFSLNSHKCDHIDDIKFSLNNCLNNNINSCSDNNSNNNNNNSNSNSFIDKRLKDIWRNIRESAVSYQKIMSTEAEISQHFEKLYQYLMVEEKKLKNKLVEKRDLMISQIENNTSELKNLVNIINISRNSNSSNRSSVDNEIIVEQQVNDMSIEDPSVSSDTTDRYSTIYIARSVGESTSLSTFVRKNSDTIFDFSESQKKQMASQLSTYQDSFDSLILDSILKHYSQFSGNIFASQMVCQCRLTTNPFDNVTLNKVIENSIQLSIEQKTELERIEDLRKQIPTVAKSLSPTTYLVTTDRDQCLSVIDISVSPYSSYHKTITKFGFISCQNSMVAVGDTVYAFGGVSNTNQYFKYSVTQKSCEFKRHLKAFGTEGPHIITIFHKGKLYSFSRNEKSIYIYDPSNNVLNKYEIDQLFDKTHMACTDGQGNIYLYSHDKRFIKFDVAANKVTQLKPLEANVYYLSMVYRTSYLDSYIYILGGTKYGNHRYSIQDNIWDSSLDGFVGERWRCPSLVLDIESNKLIY